MPTLAYFYKLGFLTCCADRGLGPAEAEALAEKVLSKRAGIGSAIGGLASGVTAIPGHALRHVGNIGASAGLGLGGVLYGNGQPGNYGLSGLLAGENNTLKPNVSDRQQVQLRRLAAMTEEIKRRKARLVQNPGLFA